MWTSNSGPPFNQPSKSSTKWAFVRYRPGTVGGGGGTHPPPHDRHSMAAGVVEKSVSTGTTAITGVAGGRSEVEHQPVALHVERHRWVVVGDRRGDQHVGVTLPGSAVLRNGEVHLERDGAVGGAGQVRRGDAAALRHGREGVPAPGRQKPLEHSLCS